MKQNKIVQIRKKKYYNLITSLSAGVLVIISLSCVCAFCISSIDIPESAINIMIDFVMCAGGFISGFQFGKLNRRKGIVGGLICGVWLALIVMFFGLLYMRKLVFLTTIGNLFFLCMSGAVGGVFGVNTKIRRPPY